ncbi:MULTISPECIES: hypothetical protein [Marinobacter]|uniref:Uncharacterized protein n=1 Tax=Marinobacter profundi TaxID=2666256 RepID=A0A2G1UKC8_9GAMM|nr:MULTISPECIES: hypothetical protein [Marinobacter]MBD3658206.1 hypothetical protein [Marinobacter sp.]PHQ14943.1 hypothetical protein CLH61_11400 [Marinobacter profundi]
MIDSSEEPSGPQDGAWNHPYILSSGETQYHELSHTRLWVTLLDKEWQVRSERTPQSVDRIRWEQTTQYVLPGAEATLQRFIRRDDNNTVTYLPALARLPTVIRPYQPLTIPAAGECTIYVGTLLWMRICVGERKTELVELPLADPSMTWVGRNTMEGDLCYSAPSYARLVLEAVPKRPWRAITPVRIVNRRDDALLLERFSLPTPLLSLYINDKGLLWTPGVTVVCETDMNSARLKVDGKVPEVAGSCQLLSPAREKSERGGLIRAFDRMFG